MGHCAKLLLVHGRIRVDCGEGGERGRERVRGREGGREREGGGRNNPLFSKLYTSCAYARVQVFVLMWSKGKAQRFDGTCTCLQTLHMMI